MRRWKWAAAAASLAGAGCSTAGQDAAQPPVKAAKCIVFLDGKGGKGAPTTLNDGVARVQPTGNEAGWGGRQWLYFPDARYDEARGVVAAAIDATECERVVIHGFSNGAAFAAALWCRGETFGGRLAGVVIDDPVTDHAVEGCTPPADVPAVLYATGALEVQAPAGTDCGPMDWTCAGGSVIGIEAYAAALGLPVQQSPNRTHAVYAAPPELTAWLDA